ncbi:MAG: mannose-1-phosphate guanylyltransferase, partial [Alistipes sp.]|nr:mannose-1-phosphate guanylyltransferase [Alistipes sp.]
MENKAYCIIMAGGKGTRFWPRSRKAKPKQFLDILGTGKTFIRSTYERFAHVVPKENFLVVTHQRYRDQVKKYLPELEDSQILCEPRSRNTAPCIAYAAYSLLRRDPEAKMIVTPADHFILQEVDFVEIIKECLGFIESENALMTLGIEPSRPDTGYGYIQRSSDALISRVKCFTEKPNLELAQAFVSCGEFLWNSGIFIWKVKDIVAAFERHLPEHHQLFESIIDDIGTERETEALERVYSECKSISIDFGVMEKADNVYVRAGDFGWSDVGTWGSVYQLSQKD